MSVNIKMKAIADEIRELSGTAEAMGLDAMASNVSEVNAEVNSQTELLTQAVLALNGKTSGGGGTTGLSVQADWNQTDETAADFIKNKPFGDIVFKKTIMPETTIAPLDFGDGIYGIEIDPTLFSDEALLRIAFDGVEYICVDNGGAYGNMAYFGEEDTGEPFLLIPSFGGMYVSDANPHVLIIDGMDYTKIEVKYLPKDALNYPAILYTDDVYLYNTEDISNAENRTTKLQLLEYFKLGYPLWVSKPDSAVYSRVSDVGIFLDGSGEYGTVVVSFSGGIPKQLYTAGYKQHNLRGG